VNLAKAYLDMARMVHTSDDGHKDTSINATASEDPERAAFEAMFALVATEFIFSQAALAAFTSAHLKNFWDGESHVLQDEYQKYTTFDDLMRREFGDTKDAVQKLAELLKIAPLHKAHPKEWQKFTEHVQEHRNFLSHPNPDTYKDQALKVMAKEWSYASSTVSVIIRYFFVGAGAAVPDWVDNGSMTVIGGIRTR